MTKEGKEYLPIRYLKNLKSMPSGYPEKTSNSTYIIYMNEWIINLDTTSTWYHGSTFKHIPYTKNPLYHFIGISEHEIDLAKLHEIE